MGAKKLRRWWRGAGLYVSLALCAAVIGAAAWWSNAARVGDAAGPPPSAAASPKPTAQPTAPALSPTPTLADALPASTGGPALLLPADGEASPWSMELTYSAALGVWRVHTGIDIICPTDAPVRACADGVVRAAYLDLLRGGVVEIDHGGGLVSVYASLGGECLVAAGDEVSAGEPIASAGECLGEPELGPHVCFTVTQDGEPRDPAAPLSP